MMRSRTFLYDVDALISSLRRFWIIMDTKQVNPSIFTAFMLSSECVVILSLSWIFSIHRRCLSLAVTEILVVMLTKTGA